MAMNIEQRLEQSAKSIEQSSQKAHDFAEKDTTIQTCAGSRDSLPKVSRIWQENFARQMNQHATEFQDRFALSQQSLPWQAGITISDSLQRYHVGVQGEEGYKEFLPNPLKLPFETAATLAEDLTQDRWLENGVPNKHWTESKVTSALEKSLGVNARIWPKDRDLQVGDVIPLAQETADGLPITHVILDGNAYSLIKKISGLVLEIVYDSIGNPRKISIDGDESFLVSLNDKSFPLFVVNADMSTAEINDVMLRESNVFFKDGEYDVTTTIQCYQNMRVTFASRCTLKPTQNGLTVLNMVDITGDYLRNLQVNYPRIDLNDKSNCIGIRAYKARNNTYLNNPWVDMRLGQNNIGILIEFLCYGLKVIHPEVINGGIGSSRMTVKNGSNAIVIDTPNLYSSDQSGDLPDYGIVVYNANDGSFSFDYVNTFPTEAVNIIGGFSQDCAKFGLFDRAWRTTVNGTYFERCALADVRLDGSYYFASDFTNHSGSVGGVCFKVTNSQFAKIKDPSRPNRDGQPGYIGMFDSDSTNISCAVELNLPLPTQNLGNTSGLIVSRGVNSVKQYTSATLPVNINEGFNTFKMNVTDGQNITISGAPYDGQVLKFILRGSDLTSLTVAGTPVDMSRFGTGAGVIRTGVVEATYWKEINKWSLSLPTFSASS
ncbi:hypothetical protein [Vibrio cholerae]|uniref:hypothetical protein n=1 Tax=Vibrio cholerae TaxID=666 RepID=UPI002271A1D3|nr:hypothetical protein [Vibrio cholerae]MCX9509912.1 hypothetical protein [Vibrio cholerae]